MALSECNQKHRFTMTVEDEKKYVILDSNGEEVASVKYDIFPETGRIYEGINYGIADKLLESLNDTNDIIEFNKSLHNEW